MVERSVRLIDRLRRPPQLISLTPVDARVPLHDKRSRPLVHATSRPPQPAADFHLAASSPALTTQRGFPSDVRTASGVSSMRTLTPTTVPPACSKRPLVAANRAPSHQSSTTRK